MGSKSEEKVEYINSVLSDLELIKNDDELLQEMRKKYLQEADFKSKLMSEDDSVLDNIKDNLDNLVQKIFSNLSHGDIVRIARHPERPTTLDYIKNIFYDFMEIRGSGALSDDAAMVGGIASLEGRNVMVIGQEKGKFENFRGGGVATAKGYKKALELMKKAESMNLPVITFIDTPGAYPDDEGLQAQTISKNIYEMVDLKVPIISVIIGEGGSGGALGIGVADKLYMLDKAYLSVISVEGACGILRREEGDKAVFDKTMSDLKVSSKDNLQNGIIDGIIDEPLRGAHTDKTVVYENIKTTLLDALHQLISDFNPDAAAAARLSKYRNTAKFRELNSDEFSDLVEQLRKDNPDDAEKISFGRRAVNYFGFGKSKKNGIELIACPNKEDKGCQDYPKKQIFTKYNGICKSCGYHFPIPVNDSLGFYLDLLVDTGRKDKLEFEEFNQNIASVNAIGFEGFDDKIRFDMVNTGRLSSLVTGYVKIDGHDVVLVISNYGFRRGTLGGAEGEKFTRAVERAIEREVPLVGVHQSGGVRINEGVSGLMQMVTTNAALVNLKSHGLPYVSVQLNATMAGVLASYASRGDFNIGEQNAQIGFAGVTVIQKTTKTELSKDFQHSENVMKRGGLDVICSRIELKNNIGRVLDFYSNKNG